jgi:class 3 adenylate cyclase/CheY-like chemotaxis protein
MDQAWKVLVADDTPQNIKVLDVISRPRGCRPVTARSGAEALQKVRDETPDLVLLDLLMLGVSGYEEVQCLRDDPVTRVLPIIMVAALEAQEEKVNAIEAGADDFPTKPVHQLELLYRVKSLLRIKEYHDTIQSQVVQLATWNTTHEARVQHQVQELEQPARLRQVLAPRLGELIASDQHQQALQSHRREVAVVFCDLRGFSASSENSEPEEVMGVLREFHTAAGEIMHPYEGTLERFAGDGMMIFFDDLIACSDRIEPAIHMAGSMRACVAGLEARWQRRRHQLDFSVGRSQGYATLGKIVFEGGYDYAAIGTATNLASRRRAEVDGVPILVSQRVHGAVEVLVTVEMVGELSLKGFSRPMLMYNIIGLRNPFPQARNLPVTVIVSASAVACGCHSTAVGSQGECPGGAGALST